MSGWNDFGNGGFKPIPNNNIFSPQTPNGTYGVIIPPFGSFGNANSTPQISGATYIKGNGYVRIEQANGHFTVYNTETGAVSSGIK